mgnify:CR=1 FL=1
MKYFYKKIRALYNRYDLIKCKLLNKYMFEIENINYQGDYNLFRGKIDINNPNGFIDIGSNVSINSGTKYNIISGESETKIKTINNGQIIIMNNVGISNSLIISSSCIKIGRGTMLGGGCRIIDTDFHSLNSFKRSDSSTDIARSIPINIGDNVFIGAYATILKGVEIGNNSVIGLGSVVTKSIPENQLWAGNPAKYIRDLQK